jgi:hypothetical protein
MWWLFQVLIMTLIIDAKQSWSTIQRATGRSRSTIAKIAKRIAAAHSG